MFAPRIFATRALRRTPLTKDPYPSITNNSRRTIYYGVTGACTVPPRSTLCIVSSTAKAGVSLFFDPTKREECLAYLNDGIIKAEVLGVPLTMSLYHELTSPLLKKYKFDPQEFLRGADVAVKSYGETRGLLLNVFLDEDSKTEKDTLDANNTNDDNELIHVFVTGATSEENAACEAAWVKDAEENPDAPRGQIMKMVTPEHFNLINQADKGLTSIKGIRKFNYKPGSTEITHMALLSARAIEVPPEPVAVDEVEDLSPEEKIKNDNLLNNIHVDSDMSVAAQVEILFEASKTYTSQDDGKSEKITNTVPEIGVMTFEGWLKGSPDGGPLRWKIAALRAPWEFGN